MTIAELITALQAYPQDTHVLVNGYECGFNDIHIVDKTVIKLKHPVHYSGDYDDEKWADLESELYEGGQFPAVVLSRVDPRD